MPASSESLDKEGEPWYSPLFKVGVPRAHAEREGGRGGGSGTQAVFYVSGADSPDSDSLGSRDAAPPATATPYNDLFDPRKEHAL